VLLLDVNVVVAAHRVDHAQHAIARPWFDELLDGDERFSVPTVVWGSFVRLATSRRIFRRPTPLEQTFEFIDSVCWQEHHVLLGPGPNHLELLRKVCEESDATGDLVADAVLAAIALEHGCVVASFDRDFARFPSIEHVIPGRS
jgi:toxin-antitoxin system PIN domain toxin